MLLRIPSLLTPEQVSDCRAALESAEWTDGRATAGYLSSRVKNNEQLPETHPVARRLGDIILDALDRNSLFMSAALPLKVVPPLFNRYEIGQTYGAHVDGAVRPVPGTPHRVRTDLSATLFLSAPDAYDGGELAIEDTYGARRVKLSAGDMVLYPGTSVHRVEPITRGTRLAAFFWIQSMVRDDARRTLLFEMDTALQQLGRDVPDHEAVTSLMGSYHNLLRRWADT
ncbi:MAG TPA: Fe2+-dependent dioxygenase [Kofleriaceae bacterium]|jgi:PKHD-type hydroxylase